MSKRKRQLKEYERKIRDAIQKREVEEKVNECSKLMPASERAREILSKIFPLCGEIGKREFKVFLVEEIGSFKVLIQIPDGKRALGHPRKEFSCDYNVWILENGKLLLPTHDYMFKWYKKLEDRLKNTNIDVYSLIEEMILKRTNYSEIVRRYEGILSNEIINDMTKFLATLKWIALQEDINYKPPEYMGSKYTLAAYALLKMNFSPSDIRKLLRFRQ